MAQDSALSRALSNSRLYQRITAPSEDGSESRQPSQSTIRAIVVNSRIYAGLKAVWRWGSVSQLAALLNDQRVLLAGAILFVVVSLVRILLSGLHVTVRFLSFALLAVVLLVLVWPYTEPLTDG